MIYEKLNLQKSLLIFGFLLIFGSLAAQKSTIAREEGPIKVVPLIENLQRPWGMTFLPDNRILLTERIGNLKIVDTSLHISDPIKGVPKVFATGQGGLLDVALDPEFENNRYVYLSYAEPGPDSTASTALGRGTFENDELKDFKVIFRMEPKVIGPNHFGGRIVFTDDGKLFLTLAERFKFEPAQDLGNHLGTIVRINTDGSVPKDNPFTDQASAKTEIWSYGHRNIESAAVDPNTGQLWIAEMGPMGGDELNNPLAGKNYGWPVVSWGDNYDGTTIPDPPTNPKFEDALIVWTPTISPSGMSFYDGSEFPEWQDHALIGGLTSSGIVVVQINGKSAEEVERIPLNLRVRDVETGPDGKVYVLTDAEKKGMLLRLEKLEMK